MLDPDLGWAFLATFLAPNPNRHVILPEFDGTSGRRVPIKDEVAAVAEAEAIFDCFVGWVVVIGGKRPRRGV